MSEIGIVVIDGREVDVSAKQLVYVTFPKVSGIERMRIEALLVDSNLSGVESTQAMPGGGIIVALRSNSPDEACNRLTELLNNSVPVPSTRRSRKARRELRKSSLGMR